MGWNPLGDPPNSPDSDDINRFQQRGFKLQEKQAEWLRNYIKNQYGKGMQSFRGGLGTFKNAYRGSMGDLKGGQRNALGQLDQTAAGSLADLAQAQKAQEGSANVNLAQRGLGNTTVAPSVMSNIASQFGRDKANILSNVAGQKAGIYQNFAPMMAQTRSNYANNIAGQQNMIGQAQMGAPAIAPVSMQLPGGLFPEGGGRMYSLYDMMANLAGEGAFTGMESDGSGLWGNGQLMSYLSLLGSI